MNTSKQKIIPHLWFDDQAEEAAEFYTSIFENSAIGNITHYVEAGQDVHGQEAGTVMTVEFEIEGYKMVGLNGGPHFTFNPSISFIVNCDTAEEVDALWENLNKGGKALMPLDSYPFSDRYGWTADKFGVTWQIMKSRSGFEQKIMPSLMFVNDQCGKAEEAIRFYTSVLDNSEVVNIAHYEENNEFQEKGTVMYADFRLEDQLFAAMDSAMEHDFTFNEAISLLVQCDSQDEVDHLWEQFTAEGQEQQCGWLKDKYGVSWQIVPKQLYSLLRDGDREKGKRVTEAMLQMKKIEIANLEKAYAEK
ncbi:MAG: VOC family protein [Candidatus Marinimicrobia bacterium]|nr:VOC family protein [Candidatus Neomarinimicrobiota bacterium]MCF7829150.1 VOC family protein [Candidatus Neomarinimicrobiota bacterium]MCF7881197.1 VOC family protein [Candidatus Neomarinimicrobiota bacterium]